VPNQCDPDDDNDGVPDENDRCFGFDDRQDQDADGTPDACDPSDGTPPVVSLGQVFVVRETSSRYNFVVEVSASDPQSGVSRIDVRVEWERRICAPELETVAEGPFFAGADNVTFFRATFPVSMCGRDEPAQIVSAQVEATATNGQGVVSAPVFTST
jgi:hypothetical protein